MQVTDQMVRANARPDADTWALLVEGHAKLGNADAALGAFRSLRNVGGARARARRAAAEKKCLPCDACPRFLAPREPPDCHMRGGSFATALHML